VRTVSLTQKSNHLYASWVGLLLGSVTMFVQFFLVDLPKRTELGEHFGQFIVHFFGFLTNLSNIWLVLIYAAFLFAAEKLRIFRDARLLASALAMMGIVTIVYHFILLPDLGPAQGIEAYTDPVKHYAVTVAFLIWWVLYVPHGKVTFRDLPFMTLPALIYLVYVFARGAIINAYPYSVIDVTKLGYLPALSYAAGVIAGFLVFCTALILADKALAKFGHSGS
jgi:hypothetical protein